MTYRVTTSDNEWYNEWQRVVQRVTTSGTMSGTTSDNEWQGVTTNDNEWLFRSVFLFFERILLIGYQKRTLYTLRKTLKRNSWIKSRFSKSSCSLEDILTARSKYRDSFFCLQHLQFQKFVKIIWHKHNLIISASVPAILISIYMRFPKNTYLGERTSWRK